MISRVILVAMLPPSGATLPNHLATMVEETGRTEGANLARAFHSVTTRVGHDGGGPRSSVDLCPAPPRGNPVRASRPVLAVGVHHVQPRQVIPQSPVQQFASGDAVLDIGGRDQYGQQQP